MIVPVLFHLPIHAGHGAHLRPDMGAAAVGLHTAAMLAVSGAVAVVVYRWVGLAFLRRGWINVDLIWALALIAAGVVLLVPGLAD